MFRGTIKNSSTSTELHLPTNHLIKCLIDHFLLSIAWMTLSECYKSETTQLNLKWLLLLLLLVPVSQISWQKDNFVHTCVLEYSLYISFGKCCQKVPPKFWLLTETRLQSLFFIDKTGEVFCMQVVEIATRTSMHWSTQKSNHWTKNLTLLSWTQKLNSFSPYRCFCGKYQNIAWRHIIQWTTIWCYYIFSQKCLSARRE